MKTTPKQSRRRFLQTAAAAGCGASLAGWTLAGCASKGRAAGAEPAKPDIPSYLRGHDKLWASDPRKASIEWFRDARFGLFLHYGLYSLLGRHEWVQLREKIPVAEYAKLKEKFTAEKFDADFITDLAIDAQMKYVNITTRHHDSFCLWDTQQTDFKSTNSPAQRDLVAELAEQCRKKGLGLFFYYSHGRDWKHPHAPNNDRWGGRARPDYDPPDPAYAYGKDHDLQKYVKFMAAQITELLTGYGPVAGIWLDGIGVTRAPKPGTGAKTEDFHCRQLYDMIHQAQPQVLVSYKQGLLGTEDFFAPEHSTIENPAGKAMEVCTTLQKGGWGWVKTADHLNADDVMQKLQAAADGSANLLLNTGPLADGAIHPQDVVTLREVGKRLAKNGWPKKA